MGGGGSDRIIASILGGPSASVTIYGDNSPTITLGTPGNDYIDARGSTVPLAINSASGNDTVYGGQGGDYVAIGDGNDEIHIGGATSTVVAGNGNDLVYGGPGANSIQTGNGNNTLVGGSGTETFHAGNGDNYFQEGPATVSITAGSGNNVVVGGSGSGGSISLGSGSNNVVGPAAGGAMIVAMGSSYIWGRGGNNTITGGAGNDVIDSGPGGNNVVNGGGGTDYLIGRSTSDTLKGSVSSFLFPNSTLSNPVPVYNPITAPNPGLASLPSVATVPGRWTEFAGSASGYGLSGNAEPAVEPTLVAGANGTIYDAWIDSRNGTSQVYAAQYSSGSWHELAGSADGGGVSQGGGAAQRPSLTLDASGQPLVVWTEIASTGSDIEAAHYLSTANGGLGGWVALGSSLNTGGLSGTGNADFASVVNTASGPVVAWLDRSSGIAQVYVCQFNGTSWTPLGTGAAGGTGITQAVSDVLNFSLATDGTKVGIAWSQRIAGVSQVFVSQYSGSAWSGLAGSNTGNGISNTLGDSTAPTIAYSGGSLFAAWQGDSLAPYDIYADMYTGTAWMAAGAGAASGGGISNSIYQSTQPHLSQGGGVLTLTWVEDLGDASTQSALYTRAWNGGASSSSSFQATPATMESS